MFFAFISKPSPTHLLLPFLGLKSDDSSMLHGSSSSKNKMNSLFISPHANGGLGKATLSTFLEDHSKAVLHHSLTTEEENNNSYPTL